MFMNNPPGAPSFRALCELWDTTNLDRLWRIADPNRGDPHLFALRILKCKANLQFLK